MLACLSANIFIQLNTQLNVRTLGVDETEKSPAGSDENSAEPVELSQTDLLI